MASRRSRERENARPWAEGVVHDYPDEPDDMPEHDEPERCPDTGDIFEDNQDAMQRHSGQAGA